MSDQAYKPNSQSQTPESQARRVAFAISTYARSRMSLAELEDHVKEISVENLIKTNWPLLKEELAKVGMANAAYIDENGEIFIYPKGIDAAKRITRTMIKIVKGE